MSRRYAMSRDRGGKEGLDLLTRVMLPSAETYTVRAK